MLQSQRLCPHIVSILFVGRRQPLTVVCLQRDNVNSCGRHIVGDRRTGTDGGIGTYLYGGDDLRIRTYKYIVSR